MAQTAPAYSLEWQRWDAAPTRSSGIGYTWDDSTEAPGYVADTVTFTSPQHPDSSGADWHYSHVNVYDSLGMHIGYVAVGYAGWPNWNFHDGCFKGNIPSANSRPLAYRLERFDRWQRNLRGAVVRYDLEGNVVWYRNTLPGILFDVIQDRNGDLVMCGFSFAQRPYPDMPQTPRLLLNPTSSASTDTLPTLDCDTAERKMNVIKMDIDGNIEWSYIYGPFDDPQTGLMNRSEGHCLVETNAGGQSGYRVAGSAKPLSETALDRWRVFMVQLSGDGHLQWKRLYDPMPVAANADVIQCSAERMARVPFSEGEVFAMSGYRRQTGNSLPSAFLWVFEQDTTTLFFKDTYQHAAYFQLNSVSQFSSGVTFAAEDTSFAIVWPVLTNITTNGSISGSIFAGNHQSEARVYKFDLSGNPLWTSPAELGVMRAFDLRFDCIQTSDGDLALASSKWSPGSSYQSSPYVFEDFPPGMQA
ncbi:MAG: hypothetical protein JNM31_15900, partial [Flavobacteriales bacterium]|nr:hypothetical protein [Flavobacteriales bacterium]